MKLPFFKGSDTALIETLDVNEWKLSRSLRIPSLKAEPLYLKWQTKMSWRWPDGTPEVVVAPTVTAGGFTISGQQKDGTTAHSDEDTNLSNSSTEMLFIVSSDIKKADPVTRKLIRSHAMQGIKKKRRRFVMVQEPSSTLAHAAPALPRRIGSDLSLAEFADEIEPLVLLNIVKG
jgi:hypothetical protein